MPTLVPLTCASANVATPDATQIVVASSSLVQWYSTSGTLQSQVSLPVIGLAGGTVGTETVTAALGETEVTLFRPGGQQTTIPGSFVDVVCSGDRLWLLSVEDHFRELYTIHIVSDPSQSAIDETMTFRALSDPLQEVHPRLWPIHRSAHVGLWMGEVSGSLNVVVEHSAAGFDFQPAQSTTPGNPWLVDAAGAAELVQRATPGQCDDNGDSFLALEGQADSLSLCERSVTARAHNWTQDSAAIAGIRAFYRFAVYGPAGNELYVGSGFDKISRLDLATRAQQQDIVCPTPYMFRWIGRAPGASQLHALLGGPKSPVSALWLDIA